MTSVVRWVALLVLVTCMAPSCGRGDGSGSARSEGHSVVLIAIDALAPRRMALYGGQTTLPAIEALAKRGLTFDDAATEVPQVRPALASLLTGRPATAHGVRDDIVDRLDETTPTIATACKAAGVSTAAFVSSPFASFSSGLGRGFDLFDGPEKTFVGPEARVPPAVPSTDVADHFSKWIASLQGSQRVFVLIELGDLQGIATRDSVTEAQRLYDDKLRVVDAAVGKIVQAVEASRIGRDADLFLIGTHGVLLGERGARGNAFWLGEETLHVPVVWAGPSSGSVAAPGQRLRNRVTIRDLTPAVASILGISLTAEPNTISLGATVPEDRVRRAWAWAPDDQLAWPPLTGVDRGHGWKVFEVSSDDRLRPASGSLAAEADLQEAERDPAKPRPRQHPANEAARLQSVGIKLGSAEPHAGAPIDREAWLEAFERTRYLVAKGSRQREKLSKDLLQRDPNAYAALILRMFLASVEPTVSDRAEIRSTLLSHYGDRQEALHWAAHSFMLEKNLEAAAVLLDAALASGPVEPELHYDRACVFSLLGRKDEAIAELRRAVDEGFREWAWMDRDSDLAAIRGEKAYGEILRTHGR